MSTFEMLTFEMSSSEGKYKQGKFEEILKFQGFKFEVTKQYGKCQH